MNIFIGAIAFFMFYLYDYNQIVLKNKLLSFSFFAGCFLLVSATILMVWESIQSGVLDRVSVFELLWITFAIIFFLLLIYTLFFSLPFEETYIDEQTANEHKNQCYQKGMYALCRHPGVLWMFGFYFMLALAFKNEQSWMACLIFNLMNLLYVILQDQWTFIHLFYDYQEYKQKVPFLLPTLKSIKNCVATWRSGDVL